MTRIGYAGLGSMGGALGWRFLAGHEVLVHAWDGAAVRRTVAGGAWACADLAELGRSCDVVLLCLPISDRVRTVVPDSGCLAAGNRPGTPNVDQTTGDSHAPAPRRQNWPGGGSTWWTRLSAAACRAPGPAPLRSWSAPRPIRTNGSSRC